MVISPPSAEWPEESRRLVLPSAQNPNDQSATRFFAVFAGKE